MGGDVITLGSDDLWEDFIKKNDIVFVDFFATWCGPCVRISPVFEKLSTEFKNAKFLKVDVDACPMTAASCGVEAMPTFHTYKNGEKVDEMVGASAENLENMIKKHSG